MSILLLILVRSSTRGRMWIAPAACLLLLASCAAAATPRPGWTLVPGARDLIQAGSWGCVPQVAAASDSVTVTAGASFNTVINIAGPLLHVEGDFSILATFSSSGAATYLTLVGTLNSGEWWNGLKRLDVGAGSNLTANYWTGDSSNATGRTFPLPPGTTGPVHLEVARIAGELVVFVNEEETGRIADPGLFASGHVYLGFNVAPQGRLVVQELAAAMPSAGTSRVSLVAPYLQVAARSSTALREMSARRGLLLGAAVDPTLFADAAYAQTLGREFSYVVAENAMKFAPTEPARGRYSFCQGDQIVAFAQANGMYVRGHNLVWQQSLPGWLTNGNFSSAEAATILREHIQAVMGHFKGRVPEWDVVNEAIAYGPPYGMQPSYWLDKLGPGYVDMAFRWAREADPYARLFYNETGAEALGTKSDIVYRLMQDMLSRGVPLDGIGLQMHVNALSPPSAASISANIKRLGELGLEVKITEMDVRIPTPATPQNLTAQANVYRDIAAACYANPNCTSILTWGVGDAHSWIPGSYPGFGAALLFDAQYQPKPAYAALAAALAPPAGSIPPAVANGGIVIHGAIPGAATPAVSPGSLADIFGANLAAAAVAAPAGAASLPVTLGGVRVSVNGVPAPLLYVSPAQIVLQVPYSTAVGAASVAVTADAVASDAAPMTVQEAAPSILTYGANRAVVQNQDASINTTTNCAPAGSYAVAYLIGSGPLTNPIPTGVSAPFDPLSAEVLTTTVTVGGASAPVIFAGMTPGFVGLMQVNFQLPAVAPGDAPLRIGVGGAQSNPATICVGP